MAAKQTDPYAQRGKQLASSVQKLRGWVGSDPSRTPELADALVELTEHRLSGHAYAEAAADAQESASLAGKLLTADGPLGPYTPVAAAARYLTAAVQLATIQSGVGLAGPAATTIDAALDLREQLPELDLTSALSVSTVIWTLLGAGRAALLRSDVPSANAYADAALLRLAATPEVDGYLEVDVESGVGAARWAAGWMPEALGHAERAHAAYEAVVDGRLDKPGGLSPALVARLSEPLLLVYGDVADRQVATGDLDRGLQTRRALVDRLRGLGKASPGSAESLAVALSDLAIDLDVAGRLEEAAVVRDESGAGSPRPRAAAGADRLPGWDPLSARAAFAVEGSASSVAELEAAVRREADERAARERAEAHRVEEERRVEAERREVEQAERERVAAAQAEAARIEAERAAVERAEREAARRAAQQAAEREETKRRREERLEEHRRETERAEAERREAERAEVDRRAARRDPDEAERQELARMAAELEALERVEAERVEAERVEAERVEAERAAEQAEAATRELERIEAERVEAARLEQERVDAEQQRLAAERKQAEQEQAEREQAEREQAEREQAEQAAAEPEQPALEPVLEAARPATSELDVARREWAAARQSGDRRAVRAATERVSDLLRPLAASEPSTYGAELVEALQQLSSARLRGGDLFGSRGPAREAKALARQFGL